MTSKNYSLIPVLAAVVMIPQLLFWWLAPAAAETRLAVYVGGSLLTFGIPAAYFVTYWNSDLRQTMGLFVVCCVLDAAVVSLSAVLLGIDASVRSAVFAFVITALICLIVLTPLINATLKRQRQGVYSASISVEPSDLPMHDIHNDNDHVPGTQAYDPIPSRMPHQGSPQKPLPPRNR